MSICLKVTGETLSSSHTHSRCMHICAYLCLCVQQQWLVSDKATDGSVSICVFVNAQMGVCVCVLCLKQCSEVLGDLSGGVEVASLWQCDRAGLSLPVMDEHSQGEHLSFLSFLFPLHPTCPLFHWDLPCVAHLLWLFLTQCVWVMISCFLVFATMFWIFVLHCFCRAAVCTIKRQCCHQVTAERINSLEKRKLALRPIVWLLHYQLH